MEALQRLHNRGSISTGFNIDNSVKLEADNTEYFSRTPSSNTNRQTFTFSTGVFAIGNKCSLGIILVGITDFLDSAWLVAS